MKIKCLIGLVLSLAVLQLSGCGKKSSDTPAPVVTKPTSTTAITGVATKGPIAGATVQAFAIRSNVTDTLPLGQARTDDKGNYTIQTFGYTGPIVVEATGGAYNDEITGSPVNLKTPLRAMFSTVGTGTTTIVVSPLTELAANQAEGAPVLTEEAIDAANRSIASAFSTTSYTLTNIVTSVPLASSADLNKTAYAAALKAFSQLIVDSMRVGDMAAGQAIDDALATVMTTLGDELKQTGGFSTTSLGAIELAQSLALGGGTTTPPSGTPPPPTPPSGIIKFGAAGTPNPADTITEIDFTITLPSGVTVATGIGSNNAAGAGVNLTNPLALSKTATLSALVAQATGTVPGRIDIIVSDAKGIAIGGQFLSVNFKTDTTLPFPVTADFLVSNVNMLGLRNKVSIAGVNVVPTSLAGF